MDIPNYEFITGKIVPRPWGSEYRFTVKNQEGRIFDEVIMLENDKVEELIIYDLISTHLKKVDIPFNESILPINPLTKELEEKDSIIISLTAEKEALEISMIEKDSIITALTEEKEALEEVIAKETPIEEVVK